MGIYFDWFTQRECLIAECSRSVLVDVDCDEFCRRTMFVCDTQNKKGSSILRADSYECSRLLGAEHLLFPEQVQPQRWLQCCEMHIEMMVDWGHLCDFVRRNQHPKRTLDEEPATQFTSFQSSPIQRRKPLTTVMKNEGILPHSRGTITTVDQTTSHTIQSADGQGQQRPAEPLRMNT